MAADRPLLNPRTSAVVAIDLHRGHLDPDVATLPLPAAHAERVVEANRRFMLGVRRLGVPIIHVNSVYRDKRELLSNPFWESKNVDAGSTRRGLERHNLVGSPGVEIMPGLYQDGETVVIKKRYSAFLHTDLDFVLRQHGVHTVLLTGVNTNSCVLCNAIEACNRDFEVVVVSDCVASMDVALHEDALRIVTTAFGWVMDSASVLRRLELAAVE